MKCQMIYYTMTHHTEEVITALKEALEKHNWDITLMPVKVSNPKEGDALKLQYTNSPKPSKNVITVFASPVQAFSLATPMKQYLRNLHDEIDAPAYYFVTAGLPKGWMGANRSIRTMQKFTQKNKAMPIESAIVHWGKKDREDQISRLISQFTASLLEYAE